MKLMDYFTPFILELTKQLEQDQERWGDEWKKRPIEATASHGHQNKRIYIRIGEYYQEWYNSGKPMPWLKIAGLAFIAWVREYDPEGYSK